MTWDTRNSRSTHSFNMTDEYRVQNGLTAASTSSR